MVVGSIRIKGVTYVSRALVLVKLSLHRILTNCGLSAFRFIVSGMDVVSAIWIVVLRRLVILWSRLVFLWVVTVGTFVATTESGTKMIVAMITNGTEHTVTRLGAEQVVRNRNLTCRFMIRSSIVCSTNRF